MSLSYSSCSIYIYYLHAYLFFIISFHLDRSLLLLFISLLMTTILKTNDGQFEWNEWEMVGRVYIIKTRWRFRLARRLTQQHQLGHFCFRLEFNFFLICTYSFADYARLERPNDTSSPHLYTHRKLICLFCLFFFPMDSSLHSHQRNVIILFSSLTLRTWTGLAKELMIFEFSMKLMTNANYLFQPPL